MWILDPVEPASMMRDHWIRGLSGVYGFVQKCVLEASEGFVSGEGEGAILVVISMSSSMSSSIYGGRDGVL